MELAGAASVRRRGRPHRTVTLGLLLGSGDQVRRPDAERDRKRRHGSEGRAALSALDTSDVVAVDTAVEAKALLGYAKLVA